METGSLILLIALIGVGLANLGCLIYVLAKMYPEKGLFHVLLGFFCCQLYPFIWGWIHASRLKMYDIMIFWSVITVFGIVLQVIYEILERSGALSQF